MSLLKFQHLSKLQKACVLTLAALLFLILVLGDPNKILLNLLLLPPGITLKLLALTIVAFVMIYICAIFVDLSITLLQKAILGFAEFLLSVKNIIKQATRKKPVQEKSKSISKNPR